MQKFIEYIFIVKILYKKLNKFLICKKTFLYIGNKKKFTLTKIFF